MTTFRLRAAVIPLLLLTATAGVLLLTATAGVQQTATPLPAAVAAPALQTARFAVDGMRCPRCPRIVRAAMSRVAGVIDVRVDFRSATAEVVFDPARTDPLAIAAASSAIGFPARSVE